MLDGSEIPQEPTTIWGKMGVIAGLLTGLAGILASLSTCTKVAPPAALVNSIPQSAPVYSTPQAATYCCAYGSKMCQLPVATIPGNSCYCTNGWSTFMTGFSCQ